MNSSLESEEKFWWRNNRVSPFEERRLRKERFREGIDVVVDEEEGGTGFEAMERKVVTVSTSFSFLCDSFVERNTPLAAIRRFSSTT